MGEISGWDISSARRPSGPGEWSAPSRLAPCSSRLRARALELESGRCRRLRKNQTTAEVNDHCDLTPTAERRHHTGAPRRHLLIGNIGSGGRQTTSPRQGYRDDSEQLCSDPAESVHEGCSPNNCAFTKAAYSEDPNIPRKPICDLPLAFGCRPIVRSMLRTAPETIILVRNRTLPAVVQEARFAG